LVVPILQERGAYKRDYLPGTLRENCSAGRAAPTQPPSWRVPPARHLQLEIQLKFGEQITRIWFPFRASGAKRETMLWTTTLRSMSCSR